MEENDVYNEFDINERNANEYEADPSVFFNKTGNPFVGFMRFLKRKPVPPKEIDEQEMLQALSEHFSNRAEYGSKAGIQAGGVVVSALLLIVFLFMFKAMNVWLCLTLVLLSAISLAIFIVWNIKSSSALNKKDNKKNGRICLSFIISNCRNSVTKQRFRHLSCQEKQRNLVII